MSLFTQWVPSTWSDEPHPDELEAYADRVVDGYTELAPNLARSVIHRQVIGPYEMEHTYGLIGGNIFHGELSVDQLFHNRPAAGYADFRSPIRGLYQAHSATHGGGGVCGIPGWQAARAILADQRRARWPWRTRRSSSVGEEQLMDRSPAPLPVEEVEASLRPFGRSRMLPARPRTSTPPCSPGSDEHFFDGGWVCAGRLEDLAEPRAQKALRDRGDRRAPHEGRPAARSTPSPTSAGTVATSCWPAGRRRVRGVVQCPYHAWTYELDGSLRLAPHFGDVPNFDRRGHGPAARRARRVGRLGLRQRRRAAPAVRASTSARSATSSRRGGATGSCPGATHHYELAANWKVAIENYHECYHCPLIHPELCRVSPSDSRRQHRRPPGRMGRRRHGARRAAPRP